MTCSLSCHPVALAEIAFPFVASSGMDSAMDPPATPVRTTIKAGTGASELVPVLQSIARGDRAALALLYRRTSAKLHGICMRLLGSEAEAEDVLQDVYVTVWQKAGRFDAAKASPITWLAVLARNKSIDRLRVRRVATGDLGEAGEIADDAPSALDLVERDQESQRLSHCLDELDEKQRAMIRAAFLDGATYPELAEREAVPLGTMKSWIRRGLLRLRGCLER
jgi:RNA polymerase sigma-70 factor (ECF subfamily)